MNTVELRQKKAKLISDARALADKGLNAETRTQYDAMIADVSTLNTDIDREESLASMESEIRSSSRPRLDQPGDVTAPKEDRSTNAKAAWEVAVRKGFNSLNAEQRSALAIEQRDLVTTTGSEGGYTVPEGFNKDIQVAIKSFGKLLQNVKTVYTDSGNPVQIPLTNDTTVVATELAQATVVSEADAVFQQITSTPTMLTSGIVRVSNSLLQDSGVDITDLLTKLFATRYGRGLNTMITTSGSANGTSIQALVGLVAQPVTIGTEGTLKYQDVVNVFTALDPGYVDAPGVAWSFNNTVYGDLLGIVDTYGRPIFVSSLASGAPDTIFGKPVFVNQALPNLGSGTLTSANAPIMFGDWQSVWVRNAGPARMKRLVERYADYDETAFCLFQRVSSNYLNAGTNPIIALKG